MANPRFNLVYPKNSARVINGSIKQWQDASTRDEQIKMEIVDIKYGGMISPLLAEAWAKQIADFLNQADDTLLNISKITRPL